jgi:predicted membrane protein
MTRAKPLSAEKYSKIKRRLNIVRWIAIPDALLLVALVALSRAFFNNRELVSILGPIHGINFLLLVMVVSLGAVDKLWKWWFPLITFFTGGPIGAFIGEVIILRQLKRSELQ